MPAHYNDLLCVYRMSNGVGYFNYDFDDIKNAPDTFEVSGFGLRWTDMYYAFVVKRAKDTTYSKIQILKQSSSSPYYFRFGTQTQPNNRILVKPGYDRSILYKPNNLHNRHSYAMYYDTTTWEPPLPSNNHLLGYVFYRTKSGITVDTTAPINMAQWDSILFADSAQRMSTQVFKSFLPSNMSFYFNIVAVYAEGRSDFLPGWTKYENYNLSVQHASRPTTSLHDKLTIGNSSTGLLISMTSRSAENGQTSLSIFSTSGRQLARFSNINSSTIVWNPFAQHLGEGLYIVKAELPGHAVLTKPFMFTK
jgi:hypothetical protein